MARAVLSRARWERKSADAWMSCRASTPSVTWAAAEEMTSAVSALPLSWSSTRGGPEGRGRKAGDADAGVGTGVAVHSQAYRDADDGEARSLLLDLAVGGAGAGGGHRNTHARQDLRGLNGSGQGPQEEVLGGDRA